MIRPLSYPFCTLASHCPDSTTYVSAHPPTPPANSPYALSPSPTDGGNTVTASRQEENVTNVIRLTTNVIGVTSQPHDEKKKRRMGHRPAPSRHQNPAPNSDARQSQSSRTHFFHHFTYVLP